MGLDKTPTSLNKSSVSRSALEKHKAVHTMGISSEYSMTNTLLCSLEVGGRTRAQDTSVEYLKGRLLLLLNDVIRRQRLVLGPM